MTSTDIALQEIATTGGPDLEPVASAIAGADRPIPLTSDLTDGLPCPVSATCTLAEAITAIANKVQSPPAIAAQSVLAAASLAAAPHSDVIIHGQRRPNSLFFVSVAGSGDRKTSTDNEAMRPVRRFEQHLLNEYNLALPAWQIADAASKSEKRRIEANRQFDYEGRKQALEELGPGPERPLQPLVVIEDYTTEGLTKLWRDASPSLGAISAEGAVFTGGHGMTSDNLRKTAATLSLLWDGKPLSSVRAGDGWNVISWPATGLSHDAAAGCSGCFSEQPSAS